MATLGRFWLKPRGSFVDVGLPGAYLLLLFWAGLIPLKRLPGPNFVMVDKVWHLLAFGALAGLSSRALRHFGQRPLSAARGAALGAVALGGLLEVLQSFTRYRSAEWADLLADSLGALLAYVTLRWLERASAASGVTAA